MKNVCYSQISTCLGECAGLCCRAVAEAMDKVAGGGLCQRRLAEFFAEAAQAALSTGKEKVTLDEIQEHFQQWKSASKTFFARWTRG